MAEPRPWTLASRPAAAEARTASNPRRIDRRRWLMLVAAPLGLSACGGSSDEGHRVEVDGYNIRKTVDKSGVYDIDVAGIHCTVTVAPNNTVKRLIVSGIDNTIHVSPGSSIETIDLAGSSNTVYVPRGLKSRIVRSGSNNDVIER